MERKLYEWKAEEHTEEVIAKLYGDKFLDDSRYASAFANDKFRFNGWGRIKIRFALSAKHIDNSAISEALENINDEAYESKLSNLLKAKAKAVKTGDNSQKYAKCMAFAIARGFEPDITRTILKDILQ